MADNRNSGQDVKNNTIKKEDSEDLKLDPNFTAYMEDYFERKRVKIPPETMQKLKDLPYSYKRKLEAKESLNNSDWLSSLRPMIFPITQLELGWLFRVAIPVAATIFIVGITIGIFYYFISKKNTSPIANNPTPISSPKPITNSPTPIPNPSASPNIVENSKANEHNQLNNNVENINNQTSIVKKENKSNKSHKSNTTNKDSSLDNQIVDNRINTQHYIPFDDTISPNSEYNRNLEASVTEIKDIKKIYIGIEELPVDTWSIKLKNELKNLLEGYWTIITNKTEKENADAGFAIDEKNKSISLFNSSKKELWAKNNFTVGKGDPKIVAQQIVSELTKIIQTNSKANK